MPTTAPDDKANPGILVVAAVILDANNRCLLALRPKHKHQGGLWEFPGGKVEAGETPLQALRRELQEELALEVQNAEPFLVTSHDYPGKRVTLDVWLVREFSGEPCGMEGQELCWYSPAELQSLAFPAANYPILQALNALIGLSLEESNLKSGSISD
ncbi:MAG: 8-oxo-dGTP diphosphatase MutT [Pseudomonadales bacterium]|jgi:8-oxo-dGTP diphosphatase|nr:8-oxo-dGTP diphosphatase MutT [Pseudomonadales bacterium]